MYKQLGFKKTSTIKDNPGRLGKGFLNKANAALAASKTPSATLSDSTVVKETKKSKDMSQGSLRQGFFNKIKKGK